MKTEINKASILSLPIYEKHDQIIEHIKHNQAIVIAGETGSGKTTQLPKFCSEAGFSRRGKIAVTQPRRIAATSMARRVADELGCSLGSRVGYRIRFDEKKSSDSEIMFMTDGILLTEIPADPLLKKYQAVIIDEAHERSLNIDFLLGYMRKILKRRPDLRLIISSATIDTDLFSEAFNAPVITVSGRLFPVEVLYAPVDDMAQESGTFTYIDAAVRMVEQIVAAGDPGDVLVFMPTEQDIMETVSRIESCGFDNTLPLPLFSRLPKNRQQRVFNCIDKRKIVVATNIAETSLTVPGIRFVIDTGLARVKLYAPHLRTNRLPVEPISRASADQRKGRCGRIEEGLCARLYEERDYETRDAFATPEIKRSNLAGAALTMLSLRLGDIGSFPFLQPPDSRTVKDAFAQLFELGALDSERRLTKYGRQMARMPLDPHVSGMPLQADKERALTEVSIIAAGLSIADPRMRPPDRQKQADFMHKRFVEPRSDFLTLLNLWNTYQTEWENLRTQNKIRRFCREHFLSFNRMREWRDVHNQIVTHIKASHSMKFNFISTTVK